MSDIVERLNKNAGWRNDMWQCVTDPNLLTEAAAEIERLNQEIDALHAEIGHRKASVVDREAVIRECAAVVEQFEGSGGQDDYEFGKDIACQNIESAILALIEQEGK